MSILARPACSDPGEISDRLWAGWAGGLGFDVGANCGQSLPLMAARFGRVVAFEPAAESWEVLHRDYGDVARVLPDVVAPVFPGLLDDGLVAGLRNLVLVHAAVSDVDGETDLFETPRNLAQGQLISPGHHAFTRECDPVARPVRCVTLDSAAAKFGMPDFVKVDTEGHEVRILAGGPRVLAGASGWLIEFHSPVMHDGCEGMLAAAGYEVETVRHPHYPAGSEDWFNHGWLRAGRP